MRRIFFLASVWAIAAASQAAYQAECFNNATIQPGGPRTGTNGKAFWNIEGPGNGSFASWAAADFNASDFAVPFTVGDISNFTVVLTESNAAFTHPGIVSFYLTTDTTNSIEPGTSPFVWMDFQNPEGFGTQLPSEFLGSYNFTSTGNLGSGNVDTYTVTLTPAAKAILINALNSNGQIRLLATHDSINGDPSVAATYAGGTNFNYDGPTLRFDASAANQTVTLAPSSFTVGLGSVVSGDVNSLASDDANALKLCKAFVPNQTSPRIRFDANFTSPYLTPSSIQLDLKARMTTGGAFKVRAFLADVSGTDTFNYGGANQVIADSTINLTFATYSSGSMAPGTHVDTDADTTADGTVRARVEIQQTGFSAVAVPCSEFELLNLTVNP